jgi:hypothetical protein
MEVEVQMADREKPQLQAKLREYKTGIARHKTDLVSRPHLRLPVRVPQCLPLAQKSLATTADRDDLLSTSSSAYVAIEMDRAESPSSPSQVQAQRSRLLSATDKLTDGQRRLEDSHRIALETEDLGSGILRDLRDQRDVLEHTRDSVRFSVLRGEGRLIADVGCGSFMRQTDPLIVLPTRLRRWPGGELRGFVRPIDTTHPFVLLLQDVPATRHHLRYHSHPDLSDVRSSFLTPTSSLVERAVVRRGYVLVSKLF